jgi:phosphonate transport system substrate-binding protein
LYCEHANLAVKYLNKRLPGAHIIVKAFPNWEEYVSCLNQNKFDITLVNGIQALDATDKGYSILGKIMDDSQFVSVIFTRKDANVIKMNDLKGKTIALPPSRMIPGTMMSLYYLYQHGLNVNNDMREINVASFESSIISTYVGKSDAGICMKRSWNVYVRDHPEILSKVDLKWETSPLINNALLVKNTTNEKITSQLMSLFFSMHTSKEGKTALKGLDVSGFEKATRDNYKPMLDFKRSYDSVIH